MYSLTTVHENNINESIYILGGEQDRGGIPFKEDFNRTTFKMLM